MMSSLKFVKVSSVIVHRALDTLHDCLVEFLSCA